MDNPQRTDTVAPFPCAVCGASFLPDASSRCEACGNFCCRDCLKVHYSVTDHGALRTMKTLCYFCYHINGNKA